MMTYQMAGIEIAFGEKAFEIVPERLKKAGCKKVLIVTDKNIVAAGGIKEAEKILCENEIEYAIYSGVEADPYSYMVDEGIEIYQKEGCQAIISIGGGSSMDVGKGISVMVCHDGNILEYTRRWENPKPITKKGCPIINVPTTCGTGSEVSKFAVLANAENHRKMTLDSKYIFSDLVVLDPVFTLTVPKEFIASCFTDALGHASEAYCHADTIKEEFVINDVIALKAVELLCANVEDVYNGTKDMEKRMHLMWGALLAGQALNIGAGESHALGAMLSKYYGVSHSVSIGVSLPACMEYCISSSPKRYYDVAKAMGADVEGMSYEEGAKEGVRHLKRLLKRMNFPTMSQFTNMQDVHKFSEECSQNSCCVLNHRMTTAEQVEKVFQSALSE